MLAYIGQDSDLSAFDITGKNVFFMPEDSVMAQGVRQALTSLGI